MKPELVIIGAGGHAKVVLDAILAQESYVIKGFCDDVIEKGQMVFEKYPVIDKVMLNDSKENHSICFVVAVGDNEDRKRLFENALKKYTPATIIHPTAVIGSNVKIGAGTVVLSKSVISAESTIGVNCIVNSGVIIDHDCRINDHVHLLPGTIVGSLSIVSVGYRSFLGERIESGSKK